MLDSESFDAVSRNRIIVRLNGIIKTFSDLDLVSVSEPFDDRSRKSGDLALKLQHLLSRNGDLSGEWTFKTIT